MNEIKKILLDDDRPLLCLLMVNAILISFPFIRDMISFYTMCVITVYSVILLIYRLFSGDLKIKPRIITWLALVFFASLLVSLIVKRDTVSEIMTNTIMIVINLIVYAAPMTAQDEETRTSHFIFLQRVTVYFGTTVICAVMFLNFIICKNIIVTPDGITLVPYMPVQRYEGIMGCNYIGFLAFLDIAFSVSIIFRKETSWTERAVLSVFCALNAVPLVISGCRSSQIAMIVFLGILVLIAIYRMLDRKILFLIVLAVALAGFLALVWKIAMSRSYSLENLSLYDAINLISSHRLPIYRLAIENGSSTLFGGGTQPVVDYFGWLCHMHNILLEIYCFYGIFAAASFIGELLIIFIFGLKFLCTSGRKGGYIYQCIIAFSVMTGILAQNMTDCFIFTQPYSVSNIAFHAVLGYVLYFITKDQGRVTDNE